MSTHAPRKPRAPDLERIERSFVAGAILGAIRVHRGLSQEAMANKCGLARTEIIAIEKGRTQFRSTDLRDALVLGFDVDEASMKSLTRGELPRPAISALFNVPISIINAAIKTGTAAFRAQYGSASAPEAA